VAASVGADARRQATAQQQQQGFGIFEVDFAEFLHQ
jgi:hypothetical protein